MRGSQHSIRGWIRQDQPCLNPHPASALLRAVWLCLLLSLSEPRSIFPTLLLTFASLDLALGRCPINTPAPPLSSVATFLLFSRQIPGSQSLFFSPRFNSLVHRVAKSQTWLKRLSTQKILVKGKREEKRIGRGKGGAFYLEIKGVTLTLWRASGHHLGRWWRWWGYRPKDNQEEAEGWGWGQLHSSAPQQQQALRGLQRRLLTCLPPDANHPGPQPGHLSPWTKYPALSTAPLTACWGFRPCNHLTYWWLKGANDKFQTVQSLGRMGETNPELLPPAPKHSHMEGCWHDSPLLKPKIHVSQPSPARLSFWVCDLGSDRFASG